MSDTKPPTVNFAKLIGPPALLPGEDATQYEALRAEVRKCFEPKSVLDEANVSDVTDKIWEAQRYKRFEVRILEGSRLSALAHLLLTDGGRHLISKFQYVVQPFWKRQT